jgi:hypothetical protein
MTVVADAEIALLEDTKLDVELQNVGLTVAEELGLKREPRLMSDLRQFSNDLVEFGGEGVKDLCHHDVAQPSSISRQISDIGDDVVIQGVITKCEKHEVAPPLVLGRRGFQNDHDHRSYVLDVGNLRIQVCDQDGVGVGASIDGAIIIVVLGDNDPVGNS